MRPIALLCLTAALAACVASPAKVLEHGKRQEFATAAAPRTLARCTAVNARSFSPYYTSSVTEMVRPDNYQVVVTELHGSYDPIIVARTSPAAGGSRLVVFTSETLDALHAADWIARLRQGC